MLLGYLDDNRSVDLSIIMDIPAFDMWSDGGSNSCSLWQYYDNMTIILLSYLMIIMSQCSSILWQYDVQILPWYVHEGGSDERGENVSQRSTRLVLHLHILWFAFFVFSIFCIMHFACFVFCIFQFCIFPTLPKWACCLAAVTKGSSIEASFCTCWHRRPKNTIALRMRPKKLSMSLHYDTFGAIHKLLFHSI